MKRRSREAEISAVNLLEESVHLLRTAPAAAFLWYLAGAIPFLLALLYFWTDMSWSADARRDCAAEALLLAVTFIWMQFAYALFAWRLRQHVSLAPKKKLSRREMFLALVSQAAFQPSKLFVLPLAAVATLPFGWVHAFYENATALSAIRRPGACWHEAWSQARFWPRQNHFLLALVTLFYLITALNIFILALFLPRLLKMFTGAENIFTLSAAGSFNSTMLAVVGAATYLCCAPLSKAIHVLRCFYGEALRSGEDLQIEFRRARVQPALVAALFFVLAFVSFPAAEATNQAAPPPPATVNVEKLNRAIDETISAPEFRWRRARVDEIEKSRRQTWLERQLEQISQAFTRGMRALGRWIDRYLSRSRSSFDRADTVGAGGGARVVMEIVLVLLIGGLLVMLGWSFRSYWRRREHSAPAKTVSKKIDPLDENVTADQLPENEWLQLAREAIARGDLRAGLRALFLAALAHLAQREMIALARHKSNRDYDRELRRRAPDQTNLHAAFLENLRELERVWYGRHGAHTAALERAQQNLALIQAA